MAPGGLSARSPKMEITPVGAISGRGEIVATGLAGRHFPSGLFFRICAGHFRPETDADADPVGR